MRYFFGLLATVLYVVASGQANAGPEKGSCSIMAPDEDGQERIFPDPGISLGTQPELVFPAGFQAATAVVCDRRVLAIGDNDYRAITELNVPVFIRSHGRVLVFQIEEGQFYVKFIKGAPTDEEISAIQSALDRAQLISQGQYQE